MKRSSAGGLEMVSVGITIVLASLLGYAGGAWIDAKMGTQPWGGVVGLLLGGAAGLVQLFRAAERLGRTSGDDDGR